MTHACDTIVVGAGVIGMFVARALRRTGRRVHVIERGEAGREASLAGGGILSPLAPWRASAAVLSLARDSQARYPAIARALYQRTGVDVEYRVCGALYLDVDDHPEIEDWCVAQDEPCESLNPAQTVAVEPAVGERAACRLPRIAQVRNPLLLRALEQDLVGDGVALSRGVEIRRVLVRGARAVGVETTQGDHQAGEIVIAAGSWSQALLEPLGIDLGVRPVRGQMLWYRSLPVSLRHIVLGSGIYVIPRTDGVCLVGSTVEEVGFDRGITASARDELARKAAVLVPGISQVPPAGQWSGLRPGIAGDRPFIGACDPIAGLFANVGHFRNGITLAPASAAMLAAAMS